MKKIEPFAPKIIVGILICLCYVTGCADAPYTGSVLTVNEVDRYLVSTDGNAVCFQDGIDLTCLKLTQETGNGTTAINQPAIHIYPERQVYVFYHEGNPILRAVRAGGNNNSNNSGSGNNNNNGDNGGNGGGNNNGNNGGGGNNGGNNGDNGGGNNNGDNNGDNGDNNGDNGGDDNNGDNNGDNGGDDNNGDNNGDNGGDDNNGDNNGDNGGDDNNGDNNGDDPRGPNGDDNSNDDSPPDNSDDGHGWIIWIYYPEGTAPQNSPTLSESGVSVSINGVQLTDDDITGFAQFIGPNNEVGVQFFYPTQSADLLDLQVRMEGVVAADDPVKFNINYLWNSN